MSTKVKVLDLTDERWLAFIASLPEANIFHHPSWVSTLAQCYGYRPFILAACDDTGMILAGLPLIEIAGLWGGRRWVSLPFTDHCAPLSRSAESLNTLTDWILAESKQRKARRVELRWPYPSRLNFHRETSHVLHGIDLNPGADALFPRFSHGHRLGIRTAQKKAVRVEWGNRYEDVMTFYRLHLQTRQRKGIPIQPQRFFDLLAHELVQSGLGFVLMAYDGKSCLAAAVFLHWQKTLTYKYSASSLDGLKMCPNDLILWTAIRWGCENGYDSLDLGRTELANTGLREFKTRWAAREIDLAYSISGTRGFSIVQNSLLEPMRTIIRHSPTFVCRAAGELLYRRLA